MDPERTPQQAEDHSWCEWIHSRLCVCVRLSNKLGKRKHVEKPGRIGFQVLSHQKKPRKKRVRWNLMMVPNRNTIWRPQSHVNTIKKATSFFYKDQKRCKGRQFHRCFGLQATKISGTVVPSWPCFSRPPQKKNAQVKLDKVETTSWRVYISTH